QDIISINNAAISKSFFITGKFNQNTNGKMQHGHSNLRSFARIEKIKLYQKQKSREAFEQSWIPSVTKNISP
ncbi:MAG TPA: hypothetical protein VFW11_20300, partial [Cyclobacteriaceae bacterium]|nr:hypothetical protein [Cyclobacteriaceae bacterium]